MADAKRRQSVVVLAALGLVLAAARLRTYAEPLERDLTTYAVIGHELLEGRWLYRDLWDHKPPAIHLAYAAAEAVAGRGRPAVYLLNVALGVLTLAGVHAAVTAAAGPAASGWWGAGFYTVLSGDLALQANQPNVEALLNPLLVWSLALLVPAAAAHRRARILGAGALLGLAVLAKPNALAFAVLLAAAPVLVADAAAGGRRRALAEAGLLLMVVAVMMLGVTVWFAGTGRLSDFAGAVFTYNRAYGGSVPWNLARGLGPERLLPRAGHDALPLVALILAGRIAGGRPSGIGRRGALLVAYAGAAYVTVAAPGRFYPHYYQIWLPLLAVAGAASLRSLPRPVAVLTAAGLVLLQLPSYRLGAEEWSRRKYGSIYVEAERAGQLADRLLGAGETLWSGESGVTFASRRRPPSGVVYDLPLRDGPLAAALTRRVLADLDANPPALVVLGGEPPLPESHPLARWVDAGYEPLDPGEPLTGFRLYRRRTGAPAGAGGGR